MKKHLLILLTLALCAALLAGCAAPSQSSSGSQSADLITEADAKRIALEHAGLAENDVNFLNVKLERDDLRRQYEVEFYSGTSEYDYEIDAASGEILSFDSDAEHHNPAAETSQTAPAQQGGEITEADAKRIALEHAGLAEDDVSFLRAKLERDDGKRVYEVEFRKGLSEYSYDIDADTGAILEYDLDND